MRVIMFKDQFAPLVRDGVKLQTIRKRANCVPGDVLSLRRWTGKPYRSKHEMLTEAVCIAVLKVSIDSCSIELPGELLTVNRLRDRFAQLDGFYGWADMRDWFKVTHGLPFDGELIQWDPSPKAVDLAKRKVGES